MQLRPSAERQVAAVPPKSFDAILALQIVAAVHALIHDELIENLCRSNTLDTPLAQRFLRLSAEHRQHDTPVGDRIESGPAKPTALPIESTLC